MYILLVILHVLVCLALIGIVLLQQGKGAEMGAAFGGSSQTLFGSSGATTFLGKLTAAAAAVFMLTSLGLTYRATTRYKSSIMPDRPAASAPAEPAEGAPSAPSSLPPSEQPAEPPAQPKAE